MGYTRRAFARLEHPDQPLALAEIPLTAPYLGPPETVLWAWSERSDAWVPYADWIFEASRRRVAAVPPLTLAESLALEDEPPC